MAQYKRISYDMAENSEIAQKSYLDYERNKDAPDEAEVESKWIAERRKLYKALDKLTPRQREVYVMRIAYQLSEVEIAKRLNISQATVSQHYHSAQAKLAKISVDLSDT